MGKSKLQKFTELVEAESLRVERYWAIADEFSMYPTTLNYSRLNAIKSFRQANSEYKSWKECKKDGYDTVRVEVTYDWVSPTSPPAPTKEGRG